MSGPALDWSTVEEPLQAPHPPHPASLKPPNDLPDPPH
jgi:hypothetical protein